MTIHADNGSSMAGKPVAFLLADLGVTRTCLEIFTRAERLGGRAFDAPQLRLG